MTFLETICFILSLIFVFLYIKLKRELDKELKNDPMAYVGAFPLPELYMAIALLLFLIGLSQGNNAFHVFIYKFLIQMLSYK